MKDNRRIGIDGIPSYAPEGTVAVFRSRIHNAFNEFLNEIHTDKLSMDIRLSENGQKKPIQKKEDRSGDGNDDIPITDRAKQYESRNPFYHFDQLVIPNIIKDEILSAIEVIRLRDKIFEEWGLKKIEPFPRTALNFYGPPGTGKTMAAHAVADYLGRPILVASYAEIESKFHGDGPKNVKAIFFASERDNALLFIDEADSLLSKRLLNVTQGSEQAINSMRSQLLICLEQFSGIVVFSTNLVENYDRAFETRVRHVNFLMPDEECRSRIWQNHLPAELPLENVCTEFLGSKIDNICGRDIKNAVIDAAVRVALQGKDRVHQNDLIESIERIKVSHVNLRKNQQRPLTDDEAKDLKKTLRFALEKQQYDSQNGIQTSQTGKE